MTETRIENEEIEFVSEKQQLEDTLCSGSASLKRISCWSHTLQLVMGTFDKYRNKNNPLPLF